MKRRNPSIMRMNIENRIVFFKIHRHFTGIKGGIHRTGAEIGKIRRRKPRVPEEDSTVIGNRR